MPIHMEKAAAKAMGAAKKIQGTVKGLSGVFTTLMEEHGEVSVMLHRLESSTDSETRARLWPTVRKELASHEEAEVEVLFGAFQQRSETSHLALHHNEEAQQLSLLIGKIEAMDIDDPMWLASLQDLVRLVRHHVQEEERHTFPAGQRALGAAMAKELNAAYLAKKRAWMEQN